MGRFRLPAPPVRTPAPTPGRLGQGDRRRLERALSVLRNAATTFAACKPDRASLAYDFALAGLGQAEELVEAVLTTAVDPGRKQ